MTAIEKYPDVDTDVVVLCAMHTLLSPLEIPKLTAAGPYNGQVPVEGHFVVVSQSHRTPLLEIGFVFFPEKKHFCQKRSALEDLARRVADVHGIDPDPVAEELQPQRRGENLFVVTSDLGEICRSVLVPLFDMVQRTKRRVGSTCIFVTSDYSADELPVKMGLKWLASKMDFGVAFAVHQFHDVFEAPGANVEVCENDEGNRCFLHLSSRLKPKSQSPYDCCRLSARRLLMQFGNSSLLRARKRSRSADHRYVEQRRRRLVERRHSRSSSGSSSTTTSSSSTSSSSSTTTTTSSSSPIASIAHKRQPRLEHTKYKYTHKVHTNKHICSQCFTCYEIFCSSLRTVMFV